MEGLGVAANVIAVVELSTKVAFLCLEYSKGVTNAKDDIARLRGEVVGLRRVANSVDELLTNIVQETQSQLQVLHERLRPKTVFPICNAVRRIVRHQQKSPLIHS